VVEVTDVLIRNLPDDVLERIDARAARLGLSRNEFLRREIAQVAGRDSGSLRSEDFAKFADLADDEIMRGSWA
jgi:plasmid stability protein